MANDESNKLSDRANSNKSTTSLPRITIVTPPDIEALLISYAQYIPRLVRNKIPRSHILPGELDDEINDISQMTLIKFWLRLTSEQTHVTAPKSYMSRIVFSQCIDLARLIKRKPIQLSENQNEEPSQGDVLLFQSEGMEDPAIEYERKELIIEVLDDVANLPPTQMKAMICMLKDEVGATFPLAEAFAKRGIDIQGVEWPEDKCKLQKLRSSLSAARKKLRGLKHKYDLDIEI